MLHLADNGVPQDEILANADTMEEFDQWVEDNHADMAYAHFNIYDKPQTATRLRAELMTMNLSKRWNIIPEHQHDLGNAIVKGQMTVRTLGKIKLDSVADAPVDSLGKMANSIRTGFANEPDINLRNIQFAHETAEFFLQHDNALRGTPSPDVKTALSMIVSDTAQTMGQSFAAIDEPQIATAFKDMSTDIHLNTYNDNHIKDPHETLTTAFSEAADHIATDTSISDDLKQQILENIDALKETGEGLKRSFDAPTPSGHTLTKTDTFHT